MGLSISVVIPAYNAEKYLRQTLESVLEQTYDDYEVIIVDDASKDGTAAIATEFVQRDPRIHYYVNEKNSGVAYTRNRGVSLAKNDWIAFVDSDDTWHREKLQLQAELAEKGGVDIIATGYGYMNPEGIVSEYWYSIPEAISYKRMLQQNCMSCSGVMLKKSLLEKHTMKHDAVHEDFYTWLVMLRDGAVAKGIDKPLHNVRVAMKESKSGNKLKSAIMTYKTYRLLGINPVASLCYFMCYIVRSVKKYSKI